MKHDWIYDDYEWALRLVHNRPTIIQKRELNARWVNQYNEEMLRAWDANMDTQFVLDPYSCAKYLMSYTTKPEREMSLLLAETHKECREGNMSAREEMKKLTGTFFNHRQVSVQETIYRATKMPLIYSSHGFISSSSLSSIFSCVMYSLSIYWRRRRDSRFFSFISSIIFSKSRQTSRIY